MISVRVKQGKGTKMQKKVQWLFFLIIEKLKKNKNRGKFVQQNLNSSEKQEKAR